MLYMLNEPKNIPHFIFSAYLEQFVYILKGWATLNLLFCFIDVFFDLIDIEFGK